MSTAEQILVAVGGADNVATLTHCWARLRFELRDADVVDEASIDALPDVALVVTQHGQFQVAMRARLLEVYDELVALLDR
jgi:phosphotransferase system IIB component